MHCALSPGGTLDDLVRSGACIDSVDMYGRTCLIVAAQEGELEVVEWLLEHDATASFQNPFDGQSALHAACLGGHERVALRLLAAGVRLTQRDLLGRTPLQCAQKNGHIGVVRALFDAQFWDRADSSSVDQRSRPVATRLAS